MSSIWSKEGLSKVMGSIHANDAYCCNCGGRYGDEIGQMAEHDHKCPGAGDEPEWCGRCGAELTENGSCDNDHSECD